MANNMTPVNIIKGSKDSNYRILLNYTPNDQREYMFLEDLKSAINACVPNFKVPAYAPSFATRDKKQVQFVSGEFPAVGKSYRENLVIAKESKLQIGTIYHYTLYLATIALRLMQQLGYPLKDAIKAVCVDSRDVGNYSNSYSSLLKIEKTGSRMIVGFYDLANTYRIVSKNYNANSYYIVGGDYQSLSYMNPLATTSNNTDSWLSCVAFFIMK